MLAAYLFIVAGLNINIMIMKKYIHVRVALLTALLSLNTFSSCVSTREALGSNEVVLKPVAGVVPFNPGAQLITYDHIIIPEHKLSAYEKIMKSACRGDFMSRLIESRPEKAKKAKKRFVRSNLNADQTDKYTKQCPLLDFLYRSAIKLKPKPRFV